VAVPVATAFQTPEGRAASRLVKLPQLPDLKYLKKVH
jgi:hypothetical protein